MGNIYGAKESGQNLRKNRTKESWFMGGLFSLGYVLVGLCLSKHTGDTDEENSAARWGSAQMRC